MATESESIDSSKINGKGDSSLLQLLSPDYKEILETIDTLRQRGISQELDLPLPQIIVCGNQSAGKSSVIEAICGKKFPKSYGCCTTFPTRLNLVRGEESFSASIRGSEINAPNGSDSFEDIIAEAKQILLDKEYSKKKEKSYFEDTLTIEISQPDLLPLQIVDLPGLIQYTNKEQTPQDKDLVEQIVRKEMSNPNSIILVIVSAKAEYQSNAALQMLNEFDPYGQRSIGVITHPDELRPGSNTLNLFVGMAKNEEKYLGLGWYVVKNLDTDVQNQPGVDSLKKRDEEEANFFGNSIWENAISPERCGISALRTDLSILLEERARSVFPKVVDIIQRELQSTRAALRKMGDPRIEPEHKRVYLTKVSSYFKHLVELSVEGRYKDPFFNSAQGICRLGMEVRTLSDQFMATMHNRGHSTEFPSALFAKSPLKDGFISWPKVKAARDVTRYEYLIEIQEMEKNYAGRTPPGLSSHDIIAPVFQRQTQKWGAIADIYAEKTTRIIHQCLEQIAKYVASDETSSIIRRYVILPAIEKKQKLTHEKIKEVLKPFLRDFISTNNLEFRQSIETGSYRETEFTAKPSDGEEFHCENSSLILDYMMAYYKVALNTFIDNVRNLCVEQCLIDDLENMFCPEKVSEMTVDTLNQLGSESRTVEAKRKALIARKETLKDLLDTCKNTNAFDMSAMYEPENNEALVSEEHEDKEDFFAPEPGNLTPNHSRIANPSTPAHGLAPSGRSTLSNITSPPPSKSASSSSTAVSGGFGAPNFGIKSSQTSSTGVQGGLLSNHWSNTSATSSGQVGGPFISVSTPPPANNVSSVGQDVWTKTPNGSSAFTGNSSTISDGLLGHSGYVTPGGRSSRSNSGSRNTNGRQSSSPWKTSSYASFAPAAKTAASQGGESSPEL